MRRNMTCTLILTAMLVLAMTAGSTNASVNGNRQDIASGAGFATAITTMMMTDGAQVGDQEVGAIAPEIVVGFANSSISIVISTAAGSNDDNATFTTGVTGRDGANARSAPTMSSINNNSTLAVPATTTVSNNDDTDRLGGGTARSGPMTGISSQNADDTDDQDDNPAPQDNNAGRTDAANTPTNKTDG